MSRCVLLVNRGAGGNQRGLDAREVCELVEERFREAGHEIQSRVVEPKRIGRALEDAVGDRPDVLLVAGGDGTVSSAARVLGGSGIALGVVPMGTFNLAARDLGIPLDPAEAAEMLAQAADGEIDVLDVAGHACLCTAIFGFYPEFADHFERRDHGGHWWRKMIKLATGLGRSFREARALSLEWRGEGIEGRARTKFASFVPGRYRESMGLMPVRTGFASGRMTGHIGRHRKAVDALGGILNYAVGRHEQDSELEVVEASALTLRAGGRRSCRVMIDGEIVRLKFPIELRVRPRHLRVLAGPEVWEGAEA